MILYVISYIPRKIDKSFDAIMYLREAYITKDYDNLNLKKTTLHVKGKLYKRLFKEPFFLGYIDSDIAPIDRAVTREANVYIRDPYPRAITYYTWGDSGLYPYYYAMAYFNKDLRMFYIQYSEETEYDGYCLVAPAKDIDDIDDIVGSR